MLRGATMEERIRAYEYAPFRDEVALLQVDYLTGRVDHLPHSSKDVADAVAGVVFHCTEQVTNSGDLSVFEAKQALSSPLTASRRGGEIPDPIRGDYRIF
jgi:hypothetical protein